MNESHHYGSRFLKFLLLFIGLYLHYTPQAQSSLSNLRVKQIDISQDTVIVDSVWMDPETVQILSLNNEELQQVSYEILKNMIIWKVKPEVPAKILYRPIPLFLTRSFYRKKRPAQALKDENFVLNPYSFQLTNTNQLDLKFDELEYDGSLIRGFSFGNRQDVVLNSSFNLQLAGNLSDEIEIVASITDNNLPIQAEGNTQQLQEFDKVFIQFKAKRHSLIVGDYNLLDEGNYHFSKYTRRLQGGYYSGKTEISDSLNVGMKAGLAFSKGKFTINRLTPLEGNQGPYKLTGENGETFLVVLAGTERVFINGKVAKRGEDFDYVIDYNLGEVTFTPNRLITQDLRIWVEFVYSERSYFRSLYNVGASIEKGDWRGEINVFSEQDNKNQPVNADLNDNQRSILREIGDSLNRAFISGAEQASFDENRIQYRLIDTLVAGIVYDSILVSSFNESIQLYNVSFSFVGKGKGDYDPANSNANGRVYNWVAPVNGESQGSYSASFKIIAPNKRQIVELAVTGKLSPGANLKANLAYSNQDVNTFSEKDDSKDDGIAFMTDLSGRKRIKNKKTLNYGLSYEFVQRSFRPIDRFRKIPYLRQWNYDPTIITNEHLASLSGGYTNKNNYFKYNVTGFVREGIYKGLNNNVKARWIKKSFDWTISADYLEASANNSYSRIARPESQFTIYPEFLPQLAIGIAPRIDYTAERDKNTDSLLANSFFDNEVRYFLKTRDSTKNEFQFEIMTTNRFKPVERAFSEKQFESQTYSITGDIKTWRSQQLRLNANFRRLISSPEETKSYDAGNFYLGRLNHIATIKKSFIRTASIYEIGSGKEQRRQISYQAVLEGGGDYQWIDFNNNGIKELDEFVVSPFSNENDHIRLVSVTPEFETVHRVVFNESVSVNPGSLIKNKKGFLSVLSKLSNATILQLERETFANGIINAAEVLNPFQIDRDTSLVSRNLQFRSTLYFNRLDPKFGMEVSIARNNTKNLITSGFEERQLQSQSALIRLIVARSLSYRINYRNGVRSNTSDFLTVNSYAYNFNEVESRLSYLLNSNFRISLIHDYSFKSNPNKLGGVQYAVENAVSLESRWSMANKSSVDVSFAVKSIGFDDSGIENQQLEFAMLQGLSDGLNYLWALAYQRKLSKALQISLQYDGRRSGNSSAIVHIGRAQVRAIF